jgi:hypothetical protein
MSGRQGSRMWLGKITSMFCGMEVMRVCMGEWNGDLGGFDVWSLGLLEEGSGWVGGSVVSSGGVQGGRSKSGLNRQFCMLVLLMPLHTNDSVASSEEVLPLQPLVCGPGSWRTLVGFCVGTDSGFCPAC